MALSILSPSNPGVVHGDTHVIKLASSSFPGRKDEVGGTGVCELELAEFVHLGLPSRLMGKS